MNFVINLFNHYGYLVLLISLILELIAFPLPGEALMTYCGYVIYTNKMSWPLAVVIAAAGVMTGITISYFIGSILGIEFFEKYGHYVHLDKKRIDKISKWSNSYGSKLLIVAYFIPGVRHVTGYFSGITKVPYKKFAMGAYSGAFIWTFTFITLGKVLGGNWEKYHSLMTRYLVIAGLIIALIILLVYAYRNYREKLQAGAADILKSSIKVFHSFGTMKVFIAGVAAIFLVFSALVIGIIQDYLANEFGEFDELARYLTTRIFDENWKGFMRIFSILSSNYALSAAAVITVILIAFKGSNKWYEIRFLVLSLLGAEGIDVVLRDVFHRAGPSGTMLTFPSGEVLMSVVAYGFLVYMLIKQFKKAWINSMVIGIYLILCGFVGISLIYFNTQYPSDVAAGFEFGMVWLSLSIILLELYRILPKIRGQNFAS